IVWLTPARHAGDGVQYFLMLESLANRGSPALAEADAAHVCRIYRSELHSDTPDACDFPPFGYFHDAHGAWYSYHFWFYPLLAVLPRLLLRAVGLPEGKAFLTVNVLMLWGSVLFVARAAPSARGRWWRPLIVLGN